MDSVVDSPWLQAECALGQQQLMRMEYLQAEHTLAVAEAAAWRDRNFDALARLYMPLQETRRQRRQRCAEGIVKMDLLAKGPGDDFSPASVIEKYPWGTVLVAGWESIEPAIQLRRLAAQRQRYLDVFLAAVDSSGKITIHALENGGDAKRNIILSRDELPRDARGTTDLWERLHQPFLADAEAESDPLKKIEAYRKAIAVDYGCELAHQHLADVARRLCQK